jgi:transposase
MCSRADVDGSIVRRNMGRPRRSTIASTAGVRREFGRASSRRRPNLLNRRNEWLSTARMSKRIAALAAEKGGASEQAIGITKGGRNSKIHGLVDKLCRPWVLILTPGNTADCTVGPACVSLLDGIAELLGDKAYDSNSFRKSLRKDGIKPVIPGRSNRKKRIRHDKQAYKDRNVIERCYCRLKDFRRIATRYDKLARNYFSALCLVAAVAFWL